MITDQAVSEDNGVVSLFNFFDSLLNSYFELLFSLDTGSESASEFFERWRVDEKEISFNGLSVELEGGVDITNNNWNKTLLFNHFNVAVSNSIVESVFSLVCVD